MWFVPQVTFDSRPTVLVPSHFDSTDRLLRQKSRRLCRPQRRPIPTPLWAAGFSFSLSSVYHQAINPSSHLHHLFFGEELLTGRSLFCSGIDCFSPAQAVVFHMYDRSHRPSYFSQVERDVEDVERSLEFVKEAILGSEEDEEGDEEGGGGEGRMERTTEMWFEEIGVESWREGVLREGSGDGGLSPQLFSDNFMTSLLSLATTSPTSSYSTTPQGGEEEEEEEEEEGGGGGGKEENEEGEKT